jgi:hypothetical protein
MTFHVVDGGWNEIQSVMNIDCQINLEILSTGFKIGIVNRRVVALLLFSLPSTSQRNVKNHRKIYGQQQFFNSFYFFEKK